MFAIDTDQVIITGKQLSKATNANSVFTCMLIIDGKT